MSYNNSSNYFSIERQLKSLIKRWQQNTCAERLVFIILGIFPSLLLTLQGSMSVLFFVLLIVSMTALYRGRHSAYQSKWDSVSILFALTMASPVLSVFLSQAYHWQFNSPNYDVASRFLFAIPIFLFLRQMPLRTFSVLQFSIPLGALITLLALLLHPFVWVENRATTSPVFNLIHFADIALTLGFLSLFAINWTGKDSGHVLGLKLCGFLAGLYMSVQTGERGAWLAIPPLLMLWVLQQSPKNRWLKLSLTVLVIIAAFGLSYAYSDVVQQRIDSIVQNLNSYMQGDRDTSIGIRLQLWQAGWQLFKDNPVFGIGSQGFEHAMPSLVANGTLTELAALMGTAEVHQEILAKAVAGGVFGLVSIVSIYLIPLILFSMAAKSSMFEPRQSALMGICLVMSFFIFGLSVEIFNLIMTATFFSLGLTIFMAVATHRSVPNE